MPTSMWIKAPDGNPVYCDNESCGTTLIPGSNILIVAGIYTYDEKCAMTIFGKEPPKEKRRIEGVPFA